MIRVPPWLAILVGAVVFAFGAFRIYIGVKPSPAQAQKKGLYGIGGRRHILIGIVYAIMGAMLAASGMGFRVFGGQESLTLDDTERGDSGGQAQ